MMTRKPTATDHTTGDPDTHEGMGPTLPFAETSRIFKALGHPTRLLLVCGLCRESSSLTRIQGALGDRISTLAQHIAVLRRCGILVEERRGPEIFLHISDPRVRRLLRVFCTHYTAEPPPEWGWDRLRNGKHSSVRRGEE